MSTKKYNTYFVGKYTLLKIVAGPIGEEGTIAHLDKLVCLCLG